MKTAEELAKLSYESCFNLQSFELAVNRSVYIKVIEKALAERDIEIISLIDEMVKELWGEGDKQKLKEENIKPINILTELKNKINGN